MTLEELIARARADINTRINLRNQYSTELSELRSADSVDEAKVEELRGKKAALDTEIHEANERLKALEEEKRSDETVARMQTETTPTSTPAREDQEQTVRVTSEPRTYAKENDPKGKRFLRDVALSFMGVRDADNRLARHMVEERTERGDDVMQRAITTGGAPGTIVPQYLTDMYAAKGRPGRKFADQCRHHDLPETGMVAYIPRQTAKTSVADQTTENTTVEESDYDDENVTVNIRTAAGSQTISRQAAERSLGLEDIIFEDLLKSYDVNLDSQLLNASTWGLLAVANAITFTSASPTAGDLYSKILGGGAKVEDTLQDLDEDDLITVMRGSRWSWFNGQLTDKWPFLAQNGFAAQTGGTNLNVGYRAGVRGQLPNGGDVVTDNNLPSNLGTGTDEDVVVVAARQELHLWEDPSAPLYIRAEQTQAKKLSIDMVVYGYYAACFNRVVDEQGTPKAVHQKITGTGLVAPTF